MAGANITPQKPVLGQLDPTLPHNFTTPTKKINDADDLNFFHVSTAYRDLTVWLLQLNRSMFPTRSCDGEIQLCSLNLPPTYSQTVQDLRAILASLSQLIDRAPPSTGPRRFGNVAFRDWYRLVHEESDSMLRNHLAAILSKYSGREESLLAELKAYFLGSFGSAQRLDYGTGHELSFLAFLGCLWKLGGFEDGEERAIVMGVIQPYLDLIRNLTMTYTLEPAGSHGVWGLDDHFFIPYIFGSAQFGPAVDVGDYSAPLPTEGSSPSAPDASAVSKRDMVTQYKDSNMYFSAIQFIYDVKKGPFWEHSPILFDISGIKDGWAKINKGMLKMYAAEVLGKFPVVQHFPFGSLFRWERDPQAAMVPASSVHSPEQPAVVGLRSMDVPPPPSRGPATAATAAPWARPSSLGATMPPLQASTGVPSRRAPLAGAGPTTRLTPPGMLSRTATHHPPPKGTADAAQPTKAPLKVRDNQEK
ncbi:MAG: hypothetical protein FE78DRAFT_29305 [Acidomyces sp. 'richmondensis']|nr:MAG: hypothetical protein FE78DRAFT_29305 [Acidomyces sp. 'richmondensis']